MVQVRNISRAVGATRRGFTLLDVLVSIAVIALIISLILPSMSMVTEAGRRVVCQSNLRQIGTGLLQYAEANNGLLAPSVFLQAGPGRSAAEPQAMIALRLDEEKRQTPDGWDGLGILYSTEIVDAPKVFYCPSHRGDLRYVSQADAWRTPALEVISNYQYRGQGPNVGAARPEMPNPMTRFLYEIDPSSTSLIADALRSREDANHPMGLNFFRADLTIRWYNDPGMRLRSRLSSNSAWDTLDAAGLGTVNEDE
jgi:type II secretory pathway pseudopilin PulG